MSAISRITNKIRGLVDDLSQSTTETFTYSSSSVFTLGETGISITSVEINGTETSGYSFSTTTNKITISATLATDDVITVKYTFYAQYTNNQIYDYIDAALVYLSTYDINDFRFVDDTSFHPYPTEKEENLIALITAILIKPNYSQYRTATVNVTYPRTKSKEEKIQDALGYYKHNSGAGAGIFFLA